MPTDHAHTTAVFNVCPEAITVQDTDFSVSLALSSRAPGSVFHHCQHCETGTATLPLLTFQAMFSKFLLFGWGEGRVGVFDFCPFYGHTMPFGQGAFGN